MAGVDEQMLSRLRRATEALRLELERLPLDDPFRRRRVRELRGDDAEATHREKRSPD